jgi:hypothetical protein
VGHTARGQVEDWARPHTACLLASVFGGPKSATWPQP